MRTFGYRLGLLLVALAVVVAQASDAAAQQGKGKGGGRRGVRGIGGFGGGFGQGMPGMEFTMLLPNEGVRKELELTDEQKKEIDDLLTASMEAGRKDFEAIGDFQSLSEEERNKKFTELREKGAARSKELKTNIDEILLPPQADRLKQLGLQLRGTRALSEAEVAEQLAITEDQKKKIEEINTQNGEETQKAMEELRSKGDQQNPDFEAFRKKGEELRKAGDEKLMAVLTDDQKKKFDEMKGEKFEFKFEGGGFGFGGGGFGGGKGRPGGGKGNKRPN